MALDELFFQSIQTIARSVISEYNQYDVTWFCTVVDNSNASIGVYTVEYQNNEYKVQSENTSYLIGDHVKVSVPNNNINDIKYITGRYIPSDSNRPITYVNPLSEILPIKTNVLSPEKVYGIIANGPEPVINIYRFTSLPRELDMCDSLVITANFQTLFTDVIKGEYGLRVEIIGDSLLTGKENVAVTKVLTSKEFIGDPYQLKVFSEQQFRVDISSLFNIKQVALYLCQDNLFETSKGRLAPSPVPDIKVRDIILYYGTSALKARENPFEIRCYDSKYYNSDNESNFKELRNYWYNYNEQGAYVGYSNGVVDPEVDIKEGKYIYDELNYEAQRSYITELSSFNSSEQPLNESGLIVKRNTFKLIALFTKTLEQLGANYLLAQLSHAESLLGAGTLSDQRQAAELAIEVIDEYFKSVEAKYKAISNFAMKRVAGKRDMDIPEIPNPLWYERAAASISNLSTSLHDTSKLAPASKQYYETNILSLIEESILTQIENILQEAKEYEDEIASILQAFILNLDDDTYWIPYAPETLEEFNNKYCIYWYRYDGINAVNVDEHGGANWSRITDLDNVGLVLTADGGLKPIGELEDTNYLAQVMLDRAKPQSNERFKAIMFFNHVPYVSQELIFENQGEKYQQVSRDLVSLKILNQGDSKDSYQFYGPNLLLLDLSQASVPRGLRAVYESEVEDFDPTGIKIVWRFPSGSTQIRNGDMLHFSRVEEGDNDYLLGYNSYVGYYQDAKQLEVTYYISELFEPNNLQNTIICELTSKNNTTVTASKSFAFSTFGNSGTDYTLVVEGPGIVTDAPDSIAEIQPKLLDYDGNEVPSEFSLRWMGPSLVSQDTTKENPYHLRHKSFNTEVTGSILLIETTAEVKGRSVKLSTPFLPKLSQSAQYSIQGPSYVIYNSHGINPTYSKLPYVLYNEAHNPIDVSWRLRYFYLDREFELDEITSAGNHAAFGLDAQYLPRLKASTNELVVSPMYLGGMENYFFLLEALKDEHVYWSQAIYMGQNRYDSNTLNTWDGKLDINEESGTILAPLIAAGRKNSDNSFEGVVMGDVARYGTETADSITFNKGHPSTGTGLYGFHQGAQSFGFLTNGTAFIGKPGAGRLWFDGNKSQISNAGYYLFESDAERLGTEFDLDDGTLHILSPGAEVYLGAKKRDNAYFSIRPRTKEEQQEVEDRSTLDPVVESEIRQTIGTQPIVESNIIFFDPSEPFLTLGLTQLKDPPYQITGLIWVAQPSDSVTIKYYKGSSVIQTVSLSPSNMAENIGTYQLYRVTVNESITTKYDSMTFECVGDKTLVYCRNAVELTYQNLVIDRSYYNLEPALVNISDSVSWIQSRGFKENNFEYTTLGGIKRFSPSGVSSLDDITLELVQNNIGNGTQIMLSTNGSIKAAAFEIVSSNVVINSQSDELPYFGVFAPWINDDGELELTTGGKPLIYVGKNEYFLQTEDYGYGKGLLFDLKNGRLNAYSGFYMKAGDITVDGNNGRILVGTTSTSYPFNLYDKFWVDSSGIISSNGLNITGGSINIQTLDDNGEVKYAFQVSSEGNLTAVNGTFNGSGVFSGTIKATAGDLDNIHVLSGTIAGWNIVNGYNIQTEGEWVGYLTSQNDFSIADKIEYNANDKIDGKPNGILRLNSCGSINTVVRNFANILEDSTPVWVETPIEEANWWIKANGEASFKRGVTIANGSGRQDALLLVTHNDANGVFQGSGRIKFSASSSSASYEYTVGIDSQGDLSFRGGEVGVFYFNRSVRVNTDSVIFSREIRNDAVASADNRHLTLQSVNGNVYIKSTSLEGSSTPGIYLNGQVYLLLGDSYVSLAEYIKYATDGTEPSIKIPIE